MKTLDQIIEREDYVKLNASLKKRAYELADKIREKYETLRPVWDSRKDDLPPYAVDVNGKWYTVRYNLYRDNGTLSTEGTVLVVFPEFPHKEWFPLADQGFRVYAKNTPSDLLVDFLNDAKTILSEIDKLENELCNNIENALKETESL